MYIHQHMCGRPLVGRAAKAEGRKCRGDYQCMGITMGAQCMGITMGMNANKLLVAR